MSTPVLTAQWHYQEFIHQGGTATATDAVNAALAWLNQTSTPAAGTVIGNTHAHGDVRLFWYGIELPHLEPPRGI